MNLLLDANVFIDYLGRKEPFFADARAIVAAGFFGDAKLWVPAQAATDAFYVLNRYVPSERLQKALLSAFEVIEPVALSAEELRRAARLSWPDYEVCLIALAADKVRADYLIARDAKGFQRSSTPVLSPAQWRELMLEEHHLDFDEIQLQGLSLSSLVQR